MTKPIFKKIRNDYANQSSSDNADSFGKATNDRIKSNRKNKNRSYVTADEWKELSQEYGRKSGGEGKDWSGNDSYTTRDSSVRFLVQQSKHQQSYPYNHQ